MIKFRNKVNFKNTLNTSFSFISSCYENYIKVLYYYYIIRIILYILYYKKAFSIFFLQYKLYICIIYYYSITIKEDFTRRTILTLLTNIAPNLLS